MGGWGTLVPSLTSLPFSALKMVNAMLVIHLPDGPTARFRLSNLKLGKDIKVGGKGV